MREGQKYNKKNYLLMHAMGGANAGGQVGSVMAVAVMLSILKEMGNIQAAVLERDDRRLFST